MKFSSNKSKYIGFSVLAVVLAMGLGLQNSLYLSDGLGNLLNLIASAPSKGNFYIDPANVNMAQATSRIFTSYGKTGTRSIPVKSNWSAQRVLDDGSYSDELEGVFLEKCTESSTCTLHSGALPKKVILKATSDGSEATAKVEVTSDVPGNPFKDSIPDWSQATIYALQKQGIMNGYQNGSFGAQDNVTRGQSVLLLYNLMKKYGIEADDMLAGKICRQYSDVASSHYAYTAICFGYHFGWLKGLASDHTFNPDQPMLRHEMALLIYNALVNQSFEKVFRDYPELKSKLGQAKALGRIFSDVTESTPNLEPILGVYALRVMNGSDGKFNALQSLNRAEAAMILSNIIKHMKQFHDADITVENEDEVEDDSTPTI